MTQEIREQIQVVIEARKRAEDAKQERDISYEGWVLKNVNLILAQTISSDLQFKAEATLRFLALAEFEATGEKKPCPGVEIKMISRLLYATNFAYEWAVKHGLALKLDQKAFEKIAKASPMDFVESIEEPQAQIATDLEKAVDNG